VSEPNYYEMLEIAPDATPEEVREAYRLLTMVWHPDRFPKDSKLWTHANEKMQQINEAYNALKNLKESDLRAPSEPAATTYSPASSPRQTDADHEQERRAQEHERQRLEARRRAEEQQRRIQEQKRREEEERRREAEARFSQESEQRRVEADRLRTLMRAAQRTEEVQRQRAEQGLCTLCGRPLSPIEKITRRNRHRDCSVFIDDSPAPTMEPQSAPTEVKESPADP